MTTATKRRKLTTQERMQRAQEALDRARSNHCPRTETEVILAFMDRGLAQEEIRPRENVLTFHAWRALGRHVRKGEKGVRIQTWIPLPDKRTQEQRDAGEDAPRRLRPKMTTVFHISQTDLDD